MRSDTVEQAPATAKKHTFPWKRVGEVAVPVAAVLQILQTVGLLDLLRKGLQRPEVPQAIRGVVRVTLDAITALLPIAWPVAVGFFFYWLLRRNLPPLIAAHVPASPLPAPPVPKAEPRPPAQSPKPITQDTITNFLQARIHEPTLNGWNNTLSADVELCSLQKLPDGAQVVEWWALFTTHGAQIRTPPYKERDIPLNPIGCTELGKAEVSAGTITGDRKQQRVSAMVHAVVRIPGHGDVKFGFGVRSQIAMVRDQP